MLYALVYINTFLLVAKMLIIPGIPHAEMEAVWHRASLIQIFQIVQMKILGKEKMPEGIAGLISKYITARRDYEKV